MLLALGMATLLGGAHVARTGTGWARALVVAGLLLVLLLFVLRYVLERRSYGDLRGTVRRVLVPTDRALGEKALRAATLALRTARESQAGPSPSGSPDLAALHLERLLARASLEAVEQSAERRASRWRWATLGLAMVAAAALVLGPIRVIEGLNVLASRGGRAPLEMAWLDLVQVTAQPPAYLRESERRLLPGVPSSQPEGTLLTVRGLPIRQGRKLVLTDGSREVPFVSDGAGAVVARWTVEESGELRIAARFGQVLIDDPESLEVTSVPDAAPEVVVEGAPSTIPLAEIERLEIRYQASDDHGLRQIDLVLAVGNREDRRVLARLDGDSRRESGATALSARDPFLRRMFLPVVITVEARDSDPLDGPKWGKSQPITVIPPAVGEPEARRYAALAAGRSALVDFLAWQLENKKARAAEERQRAARAAQVLASSMDETHGGLGVTGGLRAFLQGQVRVLTRAPRPGESSLQRTEEVVLAVDVALRSLATRDAQSVSQRLADVADEVADAAKQARETEQRTAAAHRLDAALDALGQGASQLVVLGALGQDIGSVAQGELRRIRRARQRQELTPAELAARHLAARLRRPNPSFAAKGHAGVESGGQSSDALSGKPSQADDRFNQLAGELEQLAQEHADEIERVERALSEAEQGIELDELREEAKRRADAIRRAVADLPQTGALPGSARAGAALGKEHAGAMAQSLERLALEDAVRSGRDAMSSLRDAERKAADPKTPSDWLDESALAEARKNLGRELEWAERELERLKRATEARAKGSLSTSGEREQQFAQRAGNLAGRGKSGETALPAEAVESLERAESVMREAARALDEGKGERGLELQREAQRLLERSSSGKTTDSDDSGEHRPQSRSQSSGGRGVRTGGEVPGADDGKRAEDFRRRVVEGLGKGSDGRLAPAVKRYAEGLLR
jgi:hypothetical protein